MKAPPNLLLLHTCTFPGFAALALGESLELVPLDGSGPSRRPLLQAVHLLLQRHQTGMSAVQGLLVSLGPGSFTGIRVGIATAQGLAAARGWSVWTIDSLQLYAAPWGGADAAVAVCHDARRGEVYAALYDGEGGMPPRPLVPPFCASPMQARERLQRVRPPRGKLHWTGSGVGLVHPEDPESSAEPSLESLAAAARDLARAGALPSVLPLNLEPLYLRRPDVRPPRVASP